MNLINWVVEAFEDVIDLFFIQSDLYPIDMSDEELGEIAFYDSLANASLSDSQTDYIPIGKQVK